MYELIIKNYVANMTIDNVINFAKKQNYVLTIDEANVIFYFIKNNWLTFYKGNPTNLFISLKELVRPTTYNKIMELYKKYR